MSISNAHIPKLAVVDVLSFSRFSNQSLAVEPLIAFPIRFQIVPAGRRDESQLAIVKVRFSEWSSHWRSEFFAGELSALILEAQIVVGPSEETS